MKKLFISFAVLGSGCLTSFAWDAPTMGWSSWNAYGHRINEEIIKSQASAMAANGLRNAGYLYVNIDDGAFKGRNDEGNLVIHPTRFPNGMKTVVDHIHGLGMKAGTYSDAGYNTCASFHGGDVDGIGTGLYQHDTQDINFLFKDLGFDFIKVDFCGGDPPHNSDALDLDERERYTAISEAIKATGRTDIRYNLCRWAYPGTWANDIATSWRTTEDIYMAWESVRGIIAQNLYLSAYARHGGFNDMDMLEVGRGMTTEEDKTHFGMWCIMSSPLLIGCDVTSIDDKTLVLLTNPELVALNQDPLALQAYVVSRNKGTYILVKDIETLNGKTRAVALYNPCDAAREMTLDFFDVNLGGNVKVRDLFDREDLGTFTESFTTTVPAHGTRIYRLEADTRHERHLYEAETAWISAYQELENNQVVHSGIYEEQDGLSGGAKACWLGMREDNDLIWRDVYSAEGGEYELTLAFISGADRYFTLEINGVAIKRINGNSGGWSQVSTITENVSLQPGINTVRLYSSDDWMPDIDYMQIVPVGSLEVYAHKLNATLARARRIDTDNIPAGFASVLKTAIESTADSYDSADAYLTAIANLENAISSIESVKEPYDAYKAVRSGAVMNAEATKPCGSLTQLTNIIGSCDAAVDSATEISAISSQTTILTNAVRTFLKSEDAEILPDATWDVSLLIENPTFDSDNHGWNGSPVWGSGCAEYWNRTFATSQTISGLKPGYYTAQVNALYRTGANDGGNAFNGKYENIPAVFYAGDSQIKVTSLYTHKIEDHQDLVENLSGTHALKGYVNSMYGASRAFALGLYHNTLDTQVGSDGTMTIGLKSDRSNNDCWCCFDNFRLFYHGATPASVEEINVSDSADFEYYNLQGIKVQTPVRGNIYIRRAGAATSKIIFGK